MCGLFGGCGNSLIDIERDYITELGVISQLRGTHSTGIAAVARSKGAFDISVFKDVCHSTDFFERDRVWKYLKDAHPHIIAGHCRAATIGEINHENAHPYNMGAIVGMKNGTVSKVRGQQKDETDSKALLRILQDEGVQAVVDEAKGGGYALVWIDSRDKSLNFLRNIGRPLYIMEGPGVRYWASEFAMLEFLRLRHNFDRLKFTISMLPAGSHYRYSMTDPMNAPKITEYKPTEKKGFIRAHAPSPKTSVPVTKKYEPMSADEALRQEKYGIRSQSGSPFQIYAFRGKKISAAKVRQVLSKGCANCGEIISLSNVEDSYFFSKKHYVCKDCTDDETASRLGAVELHQCRLEMGDCNGSC